MAYLRIDAKTPLTDRVAAFELVSDQDALLDAWQAGAHIDVDLGEVGTRSYSLISWPGDAALDRYLIAVQREDDGKGGSSAMHALAPGDRIEASSPKNSFALAEADEPVALIAGGIGVTPLISMATTLSATGRPFVFHYTGRSAEVMAYRARLDEVFGARLHTHVDDAKPFDLAGTVSGLADHRFYICGPKGMIEAVRAAAEAAGVPAERIHVELFTTATPEGGDDAFDVEVKSTGEVYTIPPGRSIIEVLEENGVDLVYDCQRGDCGICQVDVLDGVPDHRDVVLSQAEKESGSVMQICVSRAKSPRLVLDI